VNNENEEVKQENIEEPNNDCGKKSSDTYMLEGLIVGMLLGLLFGDSLFGIGAGLSIGVALGSGIGLCFKKNNKPNE
jgi:hypothetical protein